MVLRRLSPFLSLLVAGSCAAGSATIGGRTFTVADGFELTLAAGSGIVPRPVSASVDDQGRLYVTDSSGSNLPPAEQLKNPDHRILRLEDTDRDGTYDKTVVFAEKVMFPQGCLWHAGWVYVAAPPSIWRFRDTNNDGVADEREEWFKGGTLTGCANDIHGPYLGPDNYIYWTKGAFAEQKHERPGRSPIHDRAAHILRARPDGSDLDVVMTGGMDNPVEVAFTSDGEAVFTSTFIDFSQPGWRDGIAHAIHGAAFGKENSVLEDLNVVRTGPDLFHPFVQFGAGAPSGLCRYQSTAFGPAHKDHLFATTFNLHQVTGHGLVQSGATYASTNYVLVSTDDVDFHPTDVLEDADGSLLIVDTGGWYKLCCPTSQLAKPDVLGGVYRVRRIGHKHTADSGSRRRLVSPPQASGTSWRLKQASINRDKSKLGEFRSTLKTHLEKKSPAGFPIRVAIEGLGRLGDRESAGRILSVAAATTDSALEHACIFALIEIADVGILREGLASREPARRRAALIALDQIPAAALASSEVLPMLTEGHERLWQAARWIISRHPEWSDSLVDWFRAQLEDSGTRGSVASQLKFLAPSDSGRVLLAETARRAANGPVIRRAAYQAMAEAAPKQPPAGWIDSLLEGLRDASPELVRAVVAASRSQAAHPDVEAALRRVASSRVHPEDLRVAAFSTLPAGWAVSAEEFDALLRTGPVRDAAGALARGRLGPVQRAALLGILKSVGPLELLALLPAYESGGEEALGLGLIEALSKANARASLRPDLVRDLVKKYPESVRQAAERLVGELDAQVSQQGARLDALLGELKSHPGDIRRGQAIFMGQKAACYACHKIGYLGGNVGPDLTRISEVRTERDLLESIVFPSASFVRSYEPMSVTTRDGEEIQGVVRSENDRELVIVSGPGTERRIARPDISGQKPGTVSIMPAGLDAQLSRQELSDLLAFLRNTRWGAK